MSSSNSCFLTYIQVSQEAGQVVWYSHLFQDFPQFIVIHTVKDFGIVNKAEIDFFLELLLFWWSSRCWQFNLWFLCLFSTSLNIWKFMVDIWLKPGLENFKHYFTSVWYECNCAVVWAFFGIAFLWDWNENWPFLVLWPLLSFPLLYFYYKAFNSKVSWFVEDGFFPEKKIFGKWRYNCDHYPKGLEFQRKLSPRNEQRKGKQPLFLFSQSFPQGHPTWQAK